MLSPEHAAHLRAAAISDGVVAARHYRTVTNAGELLALGFLPRQCLVPTLLIPLTDAVGKNGRYQHRPDHPRTVRKKLTKYELPGVMDGHDKPKPIIDVHPSIQHQMLDASVPLWVTEGVKKADAAVSHGICCIAVLSTTLWNCPDWKHIELQRREVYLAFDSDTWINANVHLQIRKLGERLTDWRANVHYVRLPNGDESHAY